MCGLRWCDIDFDKKQIAVNHSLVEVSKEDSANGETLLLKDTKTDQSRRKITIDDDTNEFLRGYKEQQVYDLEYYGRIQNETTPVVADCLGEWYRPDNFTKDFEAFDQQHGFGVRLHDLRQTQASLLTAAGLPIVVVS